MTWYPPTRSSAAEAVYAAAEEDRKANPAAYSLGFDDIVERALRSGASSPDAFLGNWREALRRYLDSVAGEGRLNALGARTMGDQAAAKLAAGARTVAALAEHPERADRELLPPIVIVGGWRTGTTFLFRLLGTDPRLRAPLAIELSRPWKIAEMTPEAREALVDKMAAAPNPMEVLNPTLRMVHDYGPRLPEECVVALGTDMHNWGLPATVRLESYPRWIATQDLGPTYVRYRELLQLLDDGDGRRFVLKAPAHTPELVNLVRAFPGATIVHLHRDLVDTIASGCSLFGVFRSTYSDEVDPLELGRFQTDQTETWLRRAWDFRSSPEASRATLLDVAYSDLVSSTTAVLERVYTCARLEPPTDPAAFVEAYHRAHPRHEHGRHEYAPEDFGIDRHEIAERFAFFTPEC